MLLVKVGKYLLLLVLPPVVAEVVESLRMRRADAICLGVWLLLVVSRCETLWSSVRSRRRADCKGLGEVRRRPAEVVRRRTPSDEARKKSRLAAKMPELASVLARGRDPAV
jgi:hypothetical protein